MDLGENRVPSIPHPISISIVFLTANEIHFLWGKILQGSDDIKMRQTIWNKNQTMTSRQELVLHSSLGKRGSVIGRIYYGQGENFSPNPPARWVKNERVPIDLCSLDLV